MERVSATKITDAVVAGVFPIPRHICVANVSWSLLPYEADLLAMTQRGYLVEVEVKISLSDLKRDAAKRKWQNPGFLRRISRFYYAMPVSLWEKPAAKECVRDGAGVIVVNGWSAKIEREAQRTSAPALTASEQFDLARVGSFRAWSPQQRHRQRQLLAEHKMEQKKRDHRMQEWLADYKSKAA